MKLHQWAIIGILLLLGIAAVAGFIATSDNGSPSARKAALTAAQTDLVDVSALTTARGLAALAIGPEEQRLAQEAARVSDHEVDLAFADELREAREHTSDKDPKYRELNARIREAQAALDEDKAQIAQLKAKLAAARPAEQDNLQDQIALLEAQQAPDEDELDVAKQDLIRAGGDRAGAIERQREAHEASEDHLAQNAPAASQTAPVDLAEEPASKSGVGASPGPGSGTRSDSATLRTQSARARRGIAETTGAAAGGGAAGATGSGRGLQTRHGRGGRVLQAFFQ